MNSTAEATIIDAHTTSSIPSILIFSWYHEASLTMNLHWYKIFNSGYLDCCTSTSHPNHRLLLTNYDLGAPVPAKELQLGLEFNEAAPELFGVEEMGEDALRILNQYISLFNQIRADLEKELPQVRAASKWVAHVVHWKRSKSASFEPVMFPASPAQVQERILFVAPHLEVPKI